jgi:hypothetical protein
MVDTKIIKWIAKGLLTYIPGVAYILDKKKRTSKHSGVHAEFCYNLWLSILVLLKENGIHPNLRNIGEIGSGGSVGVGICALLTGSEKYYALEIDDLLNIDQNLKIFDDLILLFKNSTRISDKYKQINIRINNLEYPEDIIDPLFLQDKNITEIRNDILNGFKNSGRIRIIRNWETHPALNLNFIFSRAVMEHVAAPASVYKGIRNHLNPGSLMFHDIEYHSHGLTNKIDGHFFVPEYLWKIIYGKRKYFLNRWSNENHCNCIIDNGFQILKTQETFVSHSVKDEKTLYGAIIIAQKREE